MSIFFTVNRMEKSLLTVAGWKYEGVSWKTSSEGNPIYRVYHPQSGEHLYTVNGNEKNLLVAQGCVMRGFLVNRVAKKSLRRYIGCTIQMPRKFLRITIR